MILGQQWVKEKGRQPVDVYGVVPSDKNPQKVGIHKLNRECLSDCEPIISCQKV
jgi:hypothetical protein